MKKRYTHRNIRSRTTLLLLSLLLAGCVPTPTEEPIPQRDSETETTAFSALQFPTRVEDLQKGETGDCTIEWKAEVYVPEGAEPGVREATEGQFDADTLRTLTELFCDRPLFLEWTPTQKELLQKIAALKDAAKGEENPDIQDYLDYLLNAAETAPETAAHVAFAWDRISENGQWIREETDDGCSFLIAKDRFIFQRRCDTQWHEESWYLPDERPPFEPIGVPQSDARALADRTLKEMGLTDYAIRDDLTQPCLKERNLIARYAGYMFFAQRIVDGLPLLASDGWTLPMEHLPSVGAPWGTEYLQLFVTEDGVDSVYWRYPSSIGSAKRESEFVPFDTILDRAQRTLRYNFSGEETRIIIDEIRLLCGTLQKENDPNVGLVVPLWEFRYRRGTVDWDPRDDDDPEVLYLNALDGTYVEPRILHTDLLEYLMNG